MHAPRNKLLLFAGSYLLCTLLYWSGLHGEPLWDDHTFWFHDVATTSKIPLQKIWAEYSWPLSVSIQRFMLTWWGHDYVYFHLVNLGLHFLNSYLVYRIARRLRLRFAFACFLLFLIHPVNVISVNWMIQFKTLLCFTFTAASLLLFLRRSVKPWPMLGSVIFFLAAILSKSSSLPMIGVFVLIALNSFKPREYLWLLPFIAISLYGGHKILKSKITQEGVDRASSEISTVEGNQEEAGMLARSGFVSQTLTYYFWQTILPLENPPVRGPKFDPWSWVDGFHLLFIGLLAIIAIKKRALGFLVAGHLLLIPFVGLIPAPYMSITWVSDQHLYLVLPSFIYFWLRLSEEAPKKLAYVGLILFVCFYSSQTGEAVKHYQTHAGFYEASLAYNPLNVPVAYNLAELYLTKNEPQKALAVLWETVELGKLRPDVKSSRYFGYVEALYLKLRSVLERSREN